MNNNWLELVYDHINNNFHSNHLQKIIDLVKQPSIAGTGEGIEECAEMVSEILKNLGCADVHMERYVKSPIVIGTLKSTSEGVPTILMYGMYDVQPPEPLEEWTVPPYGGTIKEYASYGECVVSRGIANSKGPLVCFINAVDSIKKVLGYCPINIVFVVEGEEELGSESLVAYVKEHSEEISKYDAVYLNGPRQDEDGVPFTILGNKGILYMDIEVTGGKWGGPQSVDLHSMNAALVSSPAWHLVKALSSMKDENDNILIEGFYDDIVCLKQKDEELTQRLVDVFDENMYLSKRLTAQKFIHNLKGGDAIRELLWKPTLNIDGIWAGYTGEATKTVIAHKAYAKMDIRLVPNMTAESMLEKVKKHLEKHGFEDVKVTVRQGVPWAKTNPDSIAAKAAIAAMDASGYEKCTPWPIYPGTGPAHNFTNPPVSIPWVSYGLGQSGRIHAPDEWMTVKGLCENEMSCAAFIYYMDLYSREVKKAEKN